MKTRLFVKTLINTCAFESELFFSLIDSQIDTGNIVYSIIEDHVFYLFMKDNCLVVIDEEKIKEHSMSAMILERPEIATRIIDEMRSKYVRH